MRTDADECGRVRHLRREVLTEWGAPVVDALRRDREREEARAVTFDRQNNLVLGGTFNWNVTFGGPVLVPYTYHGLFQNVIDAFVVKFDAAGQHQWSKQLHSNFQARVASIAADASGNVAVAGAYDGGADVGSGMVYSNNYTDDAFVSVFAPNGQYRWSKAIHDSVNGSGNGVAFDSHGEVLLTGHVGGAADLGGGPIQLPGAGKVLVVKYSNAGAYRWSRTLGGLLGNDDAYGIAVRRQLRDRRHDGRVGGLARQLRRSADERCRL